MKAIFAWPSRHVIRTGPRDRQGSLNVTSVAGRIMKRQKLCLLVAAFCCLSARPAVGCPACNIYNLLAECVRESTDIYVGEVVHPVDRYKAEVKVVKVLRGSYTTGSTVTSRVFVLRWQTG